jgi:hypothetical protein
MAGRDDLLWEDRPERDGTGPSAEAACRLDVESGAATANPSFDENPLSAM